jgi:hypothetical protein
MARGSLAAAVAAASAAAAAAQTLPPLLVFWSSTHQDNAVVATAASIASLDNTYSYYAGDLQVASNSSTGPAGTVVREWGVGCARPLSIRRPPPLLAPAPSFPLAPSPAYLPACPPGPCSRSTFTTTPRRTTT